MEYVTTVINNNNLILIDQQFGQNMMSNALGFTLTANGTIDTARVLDPEQRYHLKILLERRSAISAVQIDRCKAFKEATLHMIATLDRVIKPD